MHAAINAHLLSPVPGYRQAGVSRHLSQLLAHLWPAALEDRWTVYVAPGVTRDMIAAPPSVALHTSRLPTTNPVVRIAWEQTLAPYMLLRDQPDVLLCPLNVVPLLAACPTVVTVHDLAFWHFNVHKPAKQRYLSMMTRLSARRAAHIITISEFTRREVIKLLQVRPDKVTTILDGCDERFTPLDPARIEHFRTQKGLPSHFLLFLGTLEPRKNVPVLLRAYAQAKADLNMPLLIGGGKGWLYDEIFELVYTLGLEHDVHFTGFIAHDELPFYYAAATAFVYPSLYEGFGFPPLEAMATGTPVVTTNVAALPEVVGDAALLVPPLDVTALVGALIRITTDQTLRAELHEKGLAQAQRFSWKRTAVETVQVLQSVTS